MKAHICIGGPLDGEHATSEDFFGYRPIDPKTKRPYPYGVGKKMPDGRWPWSRDPGMYAHLSREYVQFNTSSHGAAKSDVIWIHRSLLTGSISPRKR